MRTGDHALMSIPVVAAGAFNKRLRAGIVVGQALDGLTHRLPFTSNR